MGELPEARKPEDHQADQPGPAETAEDGEDPTWGPNIALHVGCDLEHREVVHSYNLQAEALVSVAVLYL